MAQLERGLRSILSVPLVYQSYQSMVGANRLHALVARIAGKTGSRTVLDVGCGTGTLAGFLSADISYLGVDMSKAYVDEAVRSHPKHSFRCGNVMDMDLAGATFDLCVAIGLLHHLDDDVATHMLKTVGGHLNPGGQFVSIDPCFADGQSLLSKAVVAADRGQNVRTSEQYERLAHNAFSSVEITVNHRLLRIPFTACVLVCRGTVSAAVETT